MDSNSNKVLYLPVRVRKYLLNDCNCPKMIEHNDFEIREVQCSMILKLFYAFEAIYMLVRSTMKIFVRRKPITMK